MTFKGVYRDGMIVPGTSLDLPEGARVSFSIHTERRKRATKPKKPAKPSRAKPRKKSPGRMTGEERVAAFMKSFGISADVPEWKGRSTAAIARELRQRALGSRASGWEPRRG